MHNRTAVIIKGNSKYNPQAENFYHSLCSFLSTLNLEVIFDDGIEYSKPPFANFWIGYSRGIDRLRFADKKTITIGVGGRWEREVNHHLDNTIKVEYSNESIPNMYHFLLSPEMKKMLKSIILNNC